MKKTLLLTFLSLFIISCDKEDADTTTDLLVSAKIEYDDIQILIDRDYTIYLFKDISIHEGGGYSAGANGVLINDETNDTRTYDEKIVTKRLYTFEGIKRGTHTITVDVTNTFKEDYPGNKMWTSSINLNNQSNQNGGSLDFVFDIRPYDSSDIYRD